MVANFMVFLYSTVSDCHGLTSDDYSCPPQGSGPF
jgi:hypothetical protein